METKINIAEILKCKPKGTKLYSPLFGDVYLSCIYNDGLIKVKHHDGLSIFQNNGRYYNYPESEPLLFPSKEMHDWSKFAWKRGDVLISNDGDSHIIFNGFLSDDYTTFEGKHWISVSTKKYVSCLNMQNTQDYHIEDNKEAAQTYIITIGVKLGGKLNRETLEIETTLPKFKDGDILVCEFPDSNTTFIFHGYDECHAYKYYVAFGLWGYIYISTGISWCSRYAEVRYATEKEKQQLFDALAKRGKAWDAEKKQIVDLKPNWTPKTFDRVITRDFDDGVWSANIFSHMNSQGEYVSIGCVEGYAYCLPYNEETAKLIGTTNNAK